MQHEGLLGVDLHQPRQIRLLLGRIDVRVLVVLEHPEPPVQPHVHAGRLDHLRLVRVDLHSPGLELGLDVTIGEQHARKAIPPPRPSPHTIRYSVHCTEAPRPASARGCSSMVELQLPKLTARVRFPSPALITKAQASGAPLALGLLCVSATVPATCPIARTRRPSRPS